MKFLRSLQRGVLALLLVSLAASAWSAARPLDEVPRTAIISAFAPELELLLKSTEQRRDYNVNGMRFTTGMLEGAPVVLFLSGVSMTNAAMNTQRALDRFHITHMVFSGIAGDTDPQHNIGDVVVPERWASYSEGIYAREVAPGEYKPSSKTRRSGLANFGMMYPRNVDVVSNRSAEKEQKTWFDVDKELLAVARELPADRLESCDPQKVCLLQKPRLSVGGSGVSGPIFMDNAAYRDYIFKVFGAAVVDMESSAVAQVAYANEVPFIAFRSLSDLAGGGEGDNEMHTFIKLAASNSANTVRAFMRKIVDKISAEKVREARGLD